MTVRIAIAAAALSGLLLWLASPAVGAAPVAWVAIVPAAAIALRGPGTRAGRLAVPLAYGIYLELSLVPSLPFGLAEGQWGDPPLLVGDTPLLPVALVAIPLLGALLYVIRFGSPWSVPGLPSAVAAVAVPAAAWTALDFLRANLDPGGAWGPLYLSQAGASAGELAALGGPWLITAAIVAANYLLAVAASSRRLVPAVAGAALIATAVATPAALASNPDGRRVAVAAVQPGYDTAEDERPELRYFLPGTYDRAALDVVADLAELTRLATRRGAELVVWPEATMFIDPRSDRRVTRRLRDLAERSGATIVVPFFRFGRSQSGVLAASPGKGLSIARPKRRPMWFMGEGSIDAQPGPLDAGGLEVGALLGVDVQDPAEAAALVDEGARLLASSTHDWKALAVQQRAAGRLEARAAGAPVVRADWRFGSAIYAADGEVLVDAGTGRRRAALLADVRAAGPTPYARLGDAVGWLALAGTLAAALVIGLRRRTSGEDAAGVRD